MRVVLSGESIGCIRYTTTSLSATLASGLQPKAAPLPNEPTLVMLNISYRATRKSKLPSLFLSQALIMPLFASNGSHDQSVPRSPQYVIHPCNPSDSILTRKDISYRRTHSTLMFMSSTRDSGPTHPTAHIHPGMHPSLP